MQQSPLRVALAQSHSIRQGGKQRDDHRSAPAGHSIRQWPPPPVLRSPPSLSSSSYPSPPPRTPTTRYRSTGRLARLPPISQSRSVETSTLHATENLLPSPLVSCLPATAVGSARALRSAHARSAIAWGQICVSPARASGISLYCAPGRAVGRLLDLICVRSRLWLGVKWMGRNNSVEAFRPLCRLVIF